MFPRPALKYAFACCAMRQSLIRPQLCWNLTSRTNSTETKKTPPSGNTEIDVVRESPYAGMSTGEKVKEATKDATYLGVSLAALGTCGIIVYFIGKELFSSESPNGVYANALKRCINHDEVRVLLGEPIKGYGETTSRGRRRHVSHHIFLDPEGRKHMRMKFYLEGPDKRGTANLEMVTDIETGKYGCRYLFVQEDLYPHRTVVIEDNR